jgi:transcriptional regulator with XRE-family HTH domain
MNSPYPSLRSLREKLGLTMDDVESASERLARSHNREQYLITTSQLSDFETKAVIPSIHQLYSLAIIYRREFAEMLSRYGVDLSQTASDLETFRPPRTHFSYALPNTEEVQKPVRVNPSFDPRTTSNFTPMVEQWGIVPVAYLQQLSKKDYSYGYIGSEDLTMNPILPPGSFVQVDESRNKVLKGGWRSEYERPIYFIETREGYYCSWCTQSEDELIVLPHPLSPTPVRVLSAQEASVIGQVVGAAIRLEHSGNEENDLEDHENRH